MSAGNETLLECPVETLMPQEKAMKTAKCCVERETETANANVESDDEDHPCHAPPQLRQIELAQCEHPPTV